MKVTTLQTTAFVVLGLLIPLFGVAERFSSWKWSDVAFFLAAYLVVLVGLISSIVRYRGKREDPLPSWRRIPYASSLFTLLVLCLLPLATWPIALSGDFSSELALGVRGFVRCECSCSSSGLSRPRLVSRGIGDCQLLGAFFVGVPARTARVNALLYQGHLPIARRFNALRTRRVPDGRLKPSRGMSFPSRTFMLSVYAPADNLCVLLCAIPYWRIL